MINYTKIKESDARASRDSSWNVYYSIQIIKLDSDSYVWKNELPNKYLVGKVGYIDYQDKFNGAIHPCRTIEEAEKKFSSLCSQYNLAESHYDDSYVYETKKECADDSEYHNRIGQ